LDAEAAVDDFDDAVFEVAPLEAVADFASIGTPPLAGRFAVRDDLRGVFADFDFALLLAI
jgi:hypothetical protein